MTEIDSIAGRVENYLVHAYSVALAKRNNLDFALAGFAHNFLKGDCGSRGCVFFLLVVTFEDLSRIIVLQRRSRSCDNFTKQIHSNGEIRSIEKSGVRARAPSLSAAERTRT